MAWLPAVLSASRSAGAILILLVPLVGGGVVPTGVLRAQEEVVPTLRGRVTAGGRPWDEGWVVLHQVSADSSGEVDSVEVAPDGRFRVTLPHVPDHATRPDIFFASVRHQGLLYFGPAITEAVQLDSLYRIRAYDTLAVPRGGVELPLPVRNLFLEKSDGGWMATDLLQIRQDRDRTLYSPEEGVIWSYPLPPAARDFQVGQADMGPDAIRFREGRMEVLTPLPPGERYFLVRYFLAEDEFTLPLPGRTDLLEILVREPGPPVEFPPLEPAEPVELEPGNVYRRYVARDLRETRIQASMAPEARELPARWLGILLAGLLGGAGVYAYRVRSGPTKRGGAESPQPTRNELLVAVARLDEEFDALENPGPRGRKRYETERKRLLAQLKELS